MKSIKLFLLIVIVAITGCKQKDTNLICYVGGTMRPPMEEIIKQYEKETGIKINLDYGGSGELLTRIKETKKGDLMVVHDPFFAETERKGLVEAGWAVAYLKPVIIVAKGNPNMINNIYDLGKPGIKVVLTDPIYSTTGYIVKAMFNKMDSASVIRIKQNVVSNMRGGYEAANAVVLKTADATIAWDAVAFLRKDEVDVIPINPEVMPKPSVDAITSATFGAVDLGKIKVTLGLLKCSSNKEGALKLAKFICSESSKKIWQKYGFSTPVSEEQLTVSDFSKTPIFLYCGAGLRKVMDKLITAFNDKYKIPVDVSYDGSNRLLGQLKLTKKGDVFIPGDAEYVQSALEDGLIDSFKHISYFLPVILVNKECKFKINRVEDLLLKGVRIGQGDVKSAAIGRITTKILEKNSISLANWNKNVVLNTATVNELGLAIKLGNIDAAIVWKAIAMDYQKEANIILIPKENNVIASIEAGVIKNSSNKEAAMELINFITSDEGKSILQESGYDMKY
ncbi:MAG: molybdate ABC transporter substrate-binding protein [Paludibacter sp.]|nr:molybdate ABC transporter substrate-binding protein [Paludibacter sp.]